MEKVFNFIKAILMFIVFMTIIGLFYDNLIINLIINILATITLLIINFKNLKIDFNRQKIIKYILLFAIVYLSTSLINLLFQNIIGQTSNNQIIQINNILNYPLINFIKICVTAPIYEEILLRQNFKKVFSNKTIYIMTTGIIFGSMHLLASTNLLELLYIIPYSLMGVYLSYVAYDSNITNSILLHSLNNIIEFIIIIL